MILVSYSESDSDLEETRKIGNQEKIKNKTKKLKTKKTKKNVKKNIQKIEKSADQNSSIINSKENKSKIKKPLFGEFSIENQEEKADFNEKIDNSRFNNSKMAIEENFAFETFSDLAKNNLDFHHFIPPDKNVAREIQNNPKIVNIKTYDPSLHEVNSTRKIENIPIHKPLNKIDAVLWDPVSNKTIQTGKISSVHKRKHQINALAEQAREYSRSILDQKAKNMMTRRETKAKYGW